ncbi:MAG: RnfABCDGE type electron transport complex subunit D [Proteobacteria bacterium]|nr:RnfABCDGE type electron transport complex subunit D [Pseudomonadota bacterium]
MTDRQFILSSSPHLLTEESVPGIMRAVVIALLPATAMGVYLFGRHALLIVLICTASALAIEAICQKALGRKITLTDWSAAVTGILMALNLPPGSPWWMAFLGSGIAIVLGKQIYGGLGYNPFNPVLVARVILLVSFPVQMTKWWQPRIPFYGNVDVVTTATPLGEMKTHLLLKGTLDGFTMDRLIDPLVGNIGGCIGEVSAIALALGGLYLLARKVISWHIPLAFLGTVFLATAFLWMLNPERFMNPMFHLFTGGLFLGAFFMATDLVTSPVMKQGMIVFGIGCGLITSVIRVFGGYPEGVSFSILLMNAATPLIDRFTAPKPFGWVEPE